MRLTLGKKIWSKRVETREHPNSSAIRCRLCATEVNMGESRSDTFAATPPLKLVRLILSWAASYKPKRAKASMIIAVFDITVAFFHGKVRKVIYVVPPQDLHKKVKVWRLLNILYGTRDASQSVCDVRGGRTQRSWFSENCGGAVFVLGRNAGSAWCALGRRLHLWHSR